MNLGLALDLSSPQGSFSFFQVTPSGPNFLEEFQLPGIMTHSETFLVHLDSALKNKARESSSLTTLVTLSGPGSFTGLRIGYASLKAIARVHRLPIITVEGPEALAWEFFQRNPQKTELSQLVVLSYLTREKWLASLFQWENRRLSKKEEWVGTAAFSTSADLQGVLVDPRIPKTFWETFADKSFMTILSSKHLIAYPHLSSTQSFSGETLQELAPQYFGSAHFS